MDPEKQMKVSCDMSDGKDIQAVQSNTAGEILPYDSQDLTLLRKIDWRIVPIMFACYMLQFIDKISLNYANVMGLQKDLHMKGNDFSWMATAFFIAYAVAEFPQGWLLQRFPPAKVLGLNVLCWGITICCSAAAQNFAGMMALRTLLGGFEAVIAPALILTTSQWYTKREAAPRYGLWYCGLGAAQTLGGLISFAAQHGPVGTSFGGWRIMMVAVGAVNVLIAFVVLWFLPDSVDSASFINAEQKAAIHRKLAVDQGGNGAKIFQANSLWEIFMDIQIWLLVLLTLLLVIPSGVISTYSATLIHGFGYTSKQTALLNMPSGAVSVIATLCSTYAILKGFPRWLSIVLLLVPTIIGAGLMSFTATTNQPSKLAGIFLLNFLVATLAIVYSWVGGNVAGYTKKVAANAVVQVAFGVANIIGPQTFQAKDAPQYLPAKITIVGVAGGAMVVSVLLRLLYGFRNRSNIKVRQAQLAALDAPEETEEDQNLTDRRNPAFVYVY